MSCAHVANGLERVVFEGVAFKDGHAVQFHSRRLRRKQCADQDLVDIKCPTLHFNDSKSATSALSAPLRETIHPRGGRDGARPSPNLESLMLLAAGCGVGGFLWYNTLQ